MVALDRNGYKRKTYDDLLNDMSSKAKHLFGENANVSERSILGILIRIMAWCLSLVWQDNENVYYSAYRKTAEGVQLDMLLPYAGVTRNLAEYAFGMLEITGTPNFTVASGFLVSTNTDIVFETIEEVVLDSEGKGVVEIKALELGSGGNVGVHTITEIVNTSADVDAVTNPIPTSGGREKETDQEARERADIAVEGLGSATTAAIRTNLLNASGVRAAAVIENFSDVVDSYGTPSRAFQSFVLGGDDTEIAYAIFEKKAGGIQPYGTEYVTIKDIGGHNQQVGFTRAVEKHVYLDVNVHTNAAFPIDGVARIKSALIRYIGGTNVDGAMYAGLNMGDDVILSRLIAKVFSVDGIDDVTIRLSIDGTAFDEANIPIDIHEVAQTDSESIEVTLNV